MTKEEYAVGWREIGRHKLRSIIKRHFQTNVEASRIFDMHIIQLQRYLSGKTVPDEGTLWKICAKLKAYSPEYFFVPPKKNPNTP
jgi:hypothetical protein